jgi:hypothetical protein
MIFAFKPAAMSPANAGTLGVTTRYRYAIELGVRASGVRVFADALVDTGADDVIIPHRDAPPDLDLTGAPGITHTVANGGSLRVQFAEVELTLFASLTHFVRWRTTVGFADVPRAVLGFRSGLEYFTFNSDTTNMRFTLLPNQRFPTTEVRLPTQELAASS